MDEKITLYELQERVKKAVESLSQGFVWITAEISEVKRNASGHWYLELADYNADDGTLTAKARAIVWSRTAAMLIPFFEMSTGSPLKAGMHVLLKVQVQYSAVYGLSLNIFDIDPSFTVGEIELQRQRVIKRLQDEGMFGVNGQIEVPLLPKRIAVVSSATAAGYRDFMKHLEGNGYGFGFKVKLYPAPMQGVEAPDGIAAALGEIAADMENGEVFDVVAVIRGGGGVLELACFDDYELALNIAQFPLPVFTGIGHDHDFHIADMVAHTYFKTPTAVAAHLIDLHMHQAAVLDSLLQRIKVSLSGKIRDNLNFLERCADRLHNGAQRIVRDELNRLQLFEYRLKGADPQQVLAKGFAIVADESGERIASAGAMQQGDTVKLLMRDGTVEVQVKKVVKN